MKNYVDAAHAMQTGVAILMGHDSRETEPKHLRVGINSAMVNDAALVKILISKGIITMEEYDQAITEEMNAEAERYQRKVKDVFGPDVAEVTLG